MDNTMVLNTGFNDLVFENRNRQYGAFQIRRRYRRNVFLSGLLASALFTSAMGAYFTSIPEAAAGEPPKTETTTIIRDIEIKEPPKPEQPKPRAITQPPPKGPDVPQQTTPQVTTAPVAPPAPTDSTGTSTKGVVGGIGVHPPDPDPCVDCDTIGQNPPPTPPIVDWATDPPVCETCDEFFLRNIRYPQAAKDQGIEGTVWLEFIVDSKGEVSDIKIAKGVHPLLDKEVLRVAPRMPAWKGGSHEGKPVNFRFRKPVRFVLGK